MRILLVILFTFVYLNSNAQYLVLEIDAPSYEIPIVKNNKYSDDLEQRFAFISDMRLMYYPGDEMLVGFGLRLYASERMAEYGDSRNYKFIASKLNELGEKELTDLLIYNWVENRIGAILRLDLPLSQSSNMILGASSGWTYAPGNLMDFTTVDKTAIVKQNWGTNKGWSTDFEIGFLRDVNRTGNLKMGLVYEYHYGNVNLNFSVDKIRLSDGELLNCYPVSKDFEISRHGIALKFQGVINHF